MNLDILGATRVQLLDDGDIIDISCFQSVLFIGIGTDTLSLKGGNIDTPTQDITGASIDDVDGSTGIVAINLIRFQYKNVKVDVDGGKQVLALLFDGRNESVTQSDTLITSLTLNSPGLT